MGPRAGRGRRRRCRCQIWREPHCRAGGRHRPTGNYFAELGTPAEALGINPAGRVANVHVAPRDVVLRSAAAPIVDTWTVPGQAYAAKGGGVQYFTARPGDYGRVAAVTGDLQHFKTLDDLNALRGTGSGVGDLSQISGTSVQDIVKNIPPNASVRRLTPAVGGSQVGLEYKWVDGNGVTNRLRMHDPDPSAGVGSNSAEGWTARWQVGKGYYDPINGDVRHPNVHNSASPFYDPAAANNTHIPIRTPEDWLLDLMKFTSP
ncbi:MAG: hypothetical protein C4K60_11820 [Ideonella sp. MAG2]|nr:MAG: hypothetical protein C4K60_11820 [Ideonella sp. MAG2]